MPTVGLEEPNAGDRSVNLRLLGLSFANNNQQYRSPPAGQINLSQYRVCSSRAHR